MTQLVDAFKKLQAKVFGRSRIKVDYEGNPTDGITFTNTKTNEKWTLSFDAESDHSSDFDSYVPDHYTYFATIKDSNGEVISSTSQDSKFYESPTFAGYPRKYTYRGIDYDKKDPCAPLYELANKAIKSYVKEKDRALAREESSKREKRNAPVEKKVRDFLK